MPQFAYGYLDLGDAYVLTQVQPGGREGLTFWDGNTVHLRGKKLMPVAKHWQQIRRAPTVIWKPDASPDVKNSGIEIEMVDLQGGGFGAAGDSNIAPIMAVSALALVAGGGYLLARAGAFSG